MVNELLFKKAVEGDKDSFIKLIEPIKENLYRVAFVYKKKKDINIDDIKVSSKLDDIIKISVYEGYDTTFSKSLSNKKSKKFNKNIVAATILVALVVTAFGSIFIAAVKLTMFDIKNYLGVNYNLDEYSTVVNEAISKNGITIQLNEVILYKDEIIVSTTIKSDKN